MNSLDQSIGFRSHDYVNKLIIQPIVSYGHLRLIENDVSKLALIIQDALENSKTTQNLASSFAHYTKNWSIDWHWIASHIIQDNYCIRHANELKNLFKRDIKVYKNTPCKMNIPEFNKLYLTDWTNPDSTPIVFSLSELSANGSNLGRKKEEWKPVIGVTDFGFYQNIISEETEHYTDSSYITHVSEGDVWDHQEKRFKYGRQVSEKAKQIAKLIKIIITDGNGKIL